MTPFELPFMTSTEGAGSNGAAYRAHSSRNLRAAVYLRPPPRTASVVLLVATSRRPPAKKTAPAKTPRIAVPGGKQSATKSDAPSPLLRLTATADPEVFLNSSGMLVNAKGVWVGLAKSQETEEAAEIRVLGEKADTPAKVMKRIALDTALPLGMRLDAAKNAAPYFDKKTPVAVEQTNQDFTLDLAAIAKLPRPERIALLKTLEKMGVDLGGKA